jgi:vitamin B12 transporter
LKKSPKKSALPKSAAGKIWLPAVLATVCGTPALAQNAGDAPIVVTARLDDPARDATGGTRSLAGEDFAAPAPVTLLESLALLPGIDAFEKGGAGGGSYLALRGGEPNFTLVVINGVRLNDPMLSSGGGFDFTLLGPGDIARIDVLSGPLSTAYGADALAGVVSLRIDPPDGAAGLATRAGFGSGGRYELGGRAALSGKAGALTLSASSRSTGSLLAGSSSEGQSAMIAAAPDLGDGFSVDLFGYYGASEGEGFPEDSGGPQLAVIRELEARERGQVALGATLRAELASTLAAQLRTGWSRSTFTSASPGVASGLRDGLPPITTDSRFNRFEAVASLDWSPQPYVNASLGASLVDERGNSDGVVDFGFPIPTTYAISRSLPGLFASAALDLPGGAALRGGLRVDFPETGKTRFTPRAGLVVPLAREALRFTANYAQGFKQPSLFALGFPLLANPDLLPERSRTYDAGFAWSSSDLTWQAELIAYRSIYRDLIDFDPDLFTNVNRNRVRAQGIELAASGRSGDFRLIASLTYLDTKSADGAQLRFRPEWKGAAALEWTASERLVLRLDGRVSGRFLDSSVPTGFVRLSGYATLDAQVRFRLNRVLELHASLRNLGGERYARTIGTPEPGRNLFVSLHAAL